MSDCILNFGMHGYGAYVWSAYGLVFGSMIVNFVKIQKREKYIRKSLKEKSVSI